MKKPPGQAKPSLFINNFTAEVWPIQLIIDDPYSFFTSRKLFPLGYYNIFKFVLVAVHRLESFSLGQGKVGLGCTTSGVPYSRQHVNRVLAALVKFGLLSMIDNKYWPNGKRRPNTYLVSNYFLQHHIRRELVKIFPILSSKVK